MTHIFTLYHALYYEQQHTSDDGSGLSDENSDGRVRNPLLGVLVHLLPAFSLGQWTVYTISTANDSWQEAALSQG